MNKSELAEMKEDRLANFAVAAFLGSLLMGQAWGMWEGSQRTAKLLIFTVPDYSGLVILSLMAGFFVLSLFLATASMVTPLQRWGLPTTFSVAPIMLPIVWVSFIFSWLSSTLELPDDQWWTPVLFVGGFVMFLFIGFRRTLSSLFRFLRQKVRLIAGYMPMADAKPDHPSDREPARPAERAVFFERIRGLRRHVRLPQSGEFWITLSVAVVMIEVLLVILLWDWLSGDESGSATIRNIGLVLAGSLAIPLAIWRAVVADRQASSTQHQTAIAQQGLLNERYQKAAEMLGSEVLSVRMGGIYALQRLAEEHPTQYHVQVIRLLCAFVRNPTKDTGIEFHTEGDEEQDEQTLRADVQDIMQAIGSRNLACISLERGEEFKLYLRGADMGHLQVRAARLSGAWLTKANLSGAVLPHADLSSARLRQANLSAAQFRHADLSDAKFWGADLSRAILYDANLSGADLCGVDANSPVYKEPVHGLTQAQLDEARADSDNPPKLDGVLDAKTGKQLIWRGSAR